MSNMDDQEPLKPTDRIASPAKSRLTPESALPNPSGERSSTFSSPKPSQEQQKSSSIFGCALTSQSSSETYQSPLFHPSMLEAPSEKLKPQNSSSNSLQQSEKDEESATVPLGGCAFVSQLNVSKSSAITGNPNPINRMPVFGTPWTGIRHSAQSFDFKVPGTRMLSFDSPPTESPKIVPTRTEERTFPTGKPTFLETSEIPVKLPPGTRPMKHLDAKRLRPGCSDAESVNPRETPIYNFSPGMNKLPVNGPLSGYDEVSEDSSSDEDKTLEDILRRAQKAKRRAAARLGENHEPRAPRKVSQKELARIKHESHRDNVVVNQLGQDVGKINLETGSGEKPGLHQP